MSIATIDRKGLAGERLTTGSVCCGEAPTASTIWRTTRRHQLWLYYSENPLHDQKTNSVSAAVPLSNDLDLRQPTLPVSAVRPRSLALKAKPASWYGPNL
jgi:hypothetical protein